MTAADMERMDTPLAVLAAEVDAIAAAKVAQRRADTTAQAVAENRHLLCDADPTDTAFAHLPCPHPETCSTSADYPGFDAWITQRQNLNTAARRTP
ncbi:hypothetical protein ACWHA3_02425 [Streptomyces cyaneofuscatus]